MPQRQEGRTHRFQAEGVAPTRATAASCLICAAILGRMRGDIQRQPSGAKHGGCAGSNSEARTDGTGEPENNTWFTPCRKTLTLGEGLLDRSSTRKASSGRSGTRGGSSTGGRSSTLGRRSTRWETFGTSSLAWIRPITLIKWTRTWIIVKIRPATRASWCGTQEVVPARCRILTSWGFSVRR